MSKARVIVTWVVGICLLISLLGISYFSWNERQENEHKLRVNTLEMTKKIYEIQDRLEKNHIIWVNVLATIPQNQQEILDKIDIIISGRMDETLKLIRAEQIAANRTSEKRRDDIMSGLQEILKTQGEEQINVIHEHQKNSRIMFMQQFELLQNKEDAAASRVINNQRQFIENWQQAHEKLDETLKLLREINR